MEVDIPEPNKGLGEWLLSSDCRRAVEERANMAMLLYQATVAKRTGALAASAHATTEIGGARSDRHIGVLLVGGRGVDYGLAHEFGVGDHPASVHNLDGEQRVDPAADDLQRVLEELHAF